MEQRTRLPPVLRRRAAARHAASVWRLVQPLRDQGMTWSEVAFHLNHAGSRTFTGRPWCTQRLCQIAPRGATAATIFDAEQRFGADLSNTL